MSKLLFVLVVVAALFAQNRDISGIWVAKANNPMTGETEIVYELKVDQNGRITGTQKLPFGDSPIIDGSVESRRGRCYERWSSSTA